MLTIESSIRTDPKILATCINRPLGGTQGTPAYLARIAPRVAARSERTGVPTSHKNVLITPGERAGLFAAILCATDEDGVVHLDPYCATYPTSIRAASCVPMPIKTGPKMIFNPVPLILPPVPRGACIPDEFAQ